jgi:hypothetical protein
LFHAKRTGCEIEFRKYVLLALGARAIQFILLLNRSTVEQSVRDFASVQ